MASFSDAIVKRNTRNGRQALFPGGNDAPAMAQIRAGGGPGSEIISFDRELRGITQVDAHVAASSVISPVAPTTEQLVSTGGSGQPPSEELAARHRGPVMRAM